MRGPVSRGALGECNAITRQGFGPSELTFACTRKPRSALPISPFLDSFPVAEDSSARHVAPESCVDRGGIGPAEYLFSRRRDGG